MRNLVHMGDESPTPVAVIAENRRGSNEHERIVLQFNLQGADADGGARVLSVHQCGEGIAWSRAGPAFGSRLARPVGINGSPAGIYKPTLAGGHDRGLRATCESIERRTA